MGKLFLPKLISTDAANDLADLRLILSDLQHVSYCIEKLEENFLDIFSTIEVMALFDSMVIRYRRCFKDGIRGWLHKEDLSLDEDEIKTHEFFVDVASKHIAHSVNGFEKNGTTFHVALNEDGTIERGGLGYQGFKTIELSPKKLNDFKSLVCSLVEKIKARMDYLRTVVEDEISNMTNDEIKKLPNGAVPLEKNVNVKENRKWPPTIRRCKKSIKLND